MPTTPPPLERPALLRLPAHKLSVFELDRSLPVLRGTNPRPLTVLDLPHEVTIPRREAAAAKLVERHTTRTPIEINHCPGGDVTAIVVKG